MTVMMEKRGNENYDSSEHAAKRSKNMVSFRLLIPTAAAGSIIGKGGENINKIKSKCCPGAYLRVPESPNRSPERLVLITCDVQDIPFIIEELTRPIFKALIEDSAIPDSHSSELLLLITTHQAGFVVGKGGSAAARIREESGCRSVKIYKDKLPYSEERVVEITGDKTQISSAVHMILEIVEENPLTYEIFHYSPSPHHRNLGDCGGYLAYRHPGLHNNSYSTKPHSQSSGGYDTPSWNNIPVQAYGQYQSRDTPAYLQRTITMDDRSVDLRRMSYDRPASERKAHGHERSDRSVSMMRTKDIYIDDCYTAHVIGSKGSQIQLIRQQSRATIKVADNDTVKDNERNIQITGSEREIEYALELINQTIMDKHEKDRELGKGESRESRAPRVNVNPFDRSELFDKITVRFPFTDISDDTTETISETIFIPNENTAPVIGPKGKRVSEIRRYTKCNINIESDNEVQGNVRRILIKGTRRQIHRASFMIENIPGTFNAN